MLTAKQDRMWRSIALGKIADKEFLKICAEFGLDYEAAIEAPMDSVAKAMRKRNERCLERR